MNMVAHDGPDRNRKGTHDDLMAETLPIEQAPDITFGNCTDGRELDSDEDDGFDIGSW